MQLAPEGTTPRRDGVESCDSTARRPPTHARPAPGNRRPSMFCSGCGQPLAPYQQVCAHCGKPAVQPPPAGYSSPIPGFSGMCIHWRSYGWFTRSLRFWRGLSRFPSWVSSSPTAAMDSHHGEFPFPNVHGLVHSFRHGRSSTSGPALGCWSASVCSAASAGREPWPWWSAF